MTKKNDNYFTSGELSNLYQISKQTLLYYDRINLLKPAFIGTNGYRHYAIEQYLNLEIILNLRRLNIPLNKIKIFLENRSPETFNQLIKEKDNDCLTKITALTKTRQELLLIQENIIHLQNIILNQILLTYELEEYLYFMPTKANITGKELIKNIARHVYDVLSKNQFKKKNVGWIIAQKEFFQSTKHKAIGFYSLYDKNVPVKKNSIYRKPAGLYLKLIFKGSYYAKAAILVKKLSEFMSLNGLEAIGDIFIMPRQNHWVASNPDNYLNEICLSVRNIKKSAI